MKKLIVLALLLLPSLSFAATQDELNTAYINALQQVIALLTQEVSLLQAQLVALPSASQSSFQGVIATTQNQISLIPAPTIPLPVLPVAQPIIPPKPNWTIDVALEAILPNQDQLVSRGLKTATTNVNTGFARFEVSVYDKDGKYKKIPITVTDNDPELPSTFTLNDPIGWFCVAPAYPPDPMDGRVFPNIGCRSENPTVVGTFDFTFTVEDVSKTVQVTVVP